MPKYQIDMTVNFSGEVYAENEDEALDYFIKNREAYYYESLESEDIEELQEEDDEEEGDEDA
jgi:hypothetical protein